MVSESKDLTSGALLWPSLPHPLVACDYLRADEDVDVAVIGAGVTGAMTAQALAGMGLKVAVLDRRPLLTGSTSATTALIQFELDTPLSQMQTEIGEAKAVRAWQRSKLAVDALTAKIQSLGIDCDARRTNSLYLAGNVLAPTGLKHEAAARRAAGLHADYLTASALEARFGLKRRGALMSYDNLSLNPLKLASSFLIKAQDAGARIYAPVTVAAVEPHASSVTVRTDDGISITARHVVYATGYEIPEALRRRRFDLQSTYAISTAPQPDKLWPERCLIWEASDPYLYLRATEDGRVICGGEDEPFEDEARRDGLIAKKTQMLERKLKTLLPQLDATAEFAWAGTFGVTQTSLPMIGRLPGMKHCYGILAFGGNGITFGALASDLITTLITGGEDTDEDLYAF